MHLNVKSLATAAGIALCATGLAFSNTNTVKADANNENYTVQAGDTLWTIAQRYQVDLNQLETLNNKDANHTIIVPGEVLKIPSTEREHSVQVTTETVSNNNSGAVQTTTAQSSTSNTQSNSNQVASTNSTVSSANTSSTNSAKEWIAQRESGGSYSARNGQYVGRYQLSSAYLNGDYSSANQERVADKYVSQRYGSWDKAKSFWQSHGWY